MTAILNANANVNGRSRASLNEQINRLDNMLDGLSEGLNEAVADAVKAVLTELLTNPEIRAQLSVPMATMAPVEPKLTWWQRTRACIAGLRDACMGCVRGTAVRIGSVCRQTCAHVGAWREYAQMLAPFRNQILLALIVGTLIGIGILDAGPWISAAVSGIGGFCTTLAVQAGLWVRKSLAMEGREMA